MTDYELDKRLKKIESDIQEIKATVGSPIVKEFITERRTSVMKVLVEILQALKTR